MAKGKADVVRIPDIEIIVSAAGSDVYVVSFYAGSNPHEEWEIVTGISHHDDAVYIREALQTAISSLNQTRWFSVDELGVGPVSEEDAPPF